MTGSKPFTGNFASVMNQVINSQPAKPSQLNPKLAPCMDEVLQKALAKKRADRYQTANEFSEAFSHAINVSLGVPVTDAGLPATSSAMLLNASRHLNAASAQPAPDDTVTIDEAAGGSQISLDISVKKARILVVDDEERILNALKSLFRHRYHVFCTTDGYKALDFL